MATLSAAQRAALLDEFTRLVTPYVPTVGTPKAQAELAAAFLKEEKVLQQCLELGPNVDFTELTEDDTRRLDAIAKGAVIAMVLDQVGEGTLITALSERERAVVQRVLLQAVPAAHVEAMAEAMPGLRDNARELVAQSMMNLDEAFAEFLGAFSAFSIADMTEEDEAQAIVATNAIFTRMMEKMEKQQAGANDDDDDDDDSDDYDEDSGLFLTEVELDGVMDDGTLAGKIAPSLSEEKRAAITRLIAAATPSAMCHSLPIAASNLKIPFVDMVMADDSKLQKFLAATEELDLADLSAPHKQFAVAAAQYAFFGGKKPKRSDLEATTPAPEPEQTAE